MPSKQSCISSIGVQYTAVVNRELRELKTKKQQNEKQQQQKTKDQPRFVCLIKHCCRSHCFSECGTAWKEKISSPVFNISLIKNPQSFFAFIKCGKASLM